MKQLASRPNSLAWWRAMFLTSAWPRSLLLHRQQGIQQVILLVLCLLWSVAQVPILLFARCPRLGQPPVARCGRPAGAGPDAWHLRGFREEGRFPRRWHLPA
jgi:hypothetical protein